MTTFYCFSFETPQTWRARSPYLYPLETGGSVIRPGTAFPFRRLLQLERAKWRHSTLPKLLGMGPTENTAQSLPWEHICLRSRYSVTALVYLLLSRKLSTKESTCYNMTWIPLQYCRIVSYDKLISIRLVMNYLHHLLGRRCIPAFTIPRHWNIFYSNLSRPHFTLLRNIFVLFSLRTPPIPLVLQEITFLLLATTD
jgi:hypothetical protein